MGVSMNYKTKTLNKCSFVNLNTDPLKPLAKNTQQQKKKQIRFNEDKITAIAKWRDSWFKGKYECPTKLL